MTAYQTNLFGAAEPVKAKKQKGNPGQLNLFSAQQTIQLLTAK